MGAYCGELYPGWRWFEKEAARRFVATSRDDEVPVFYNAVVEREPTDPRGYDALFIDGMVKGSILTRASHSCDPNAAMRVRVRDGKYAVEMWTVRAVAESEEICWDYQCRTDSEEEMRRALCCCGAKGVASATSTTKTIQPTTRTSRARIARAFRRSAHSVTGTTTTKSTTTPRRSSRTRGSKRHARRARNSRGAPALARSIRGDVRVVRGGGKNRARGDCSTTRRAAKRAEEAADDETKVAGSGSGADAIVDLPRLRAEATAEAESVAAGRLQSPRGDPR